MKFSAKFKKIAPLEMKQKMLNDIVREALQFAADYWIKNYLPLHFEPGSASQRYQYKARGTKYLAIKRRMKMVRPWLGPGKKGAPIPAPQPVRPWQWTGATRKRLLEGKLNIRATATRNKQSVKVPLPIPHPIPPDISGELGRLTNEEFKTLHELAFQYAKDKLDQVRGEMTVKIAA